MTHPLETPGTGTSGTGPGVTGTGCAPPGGALPRRESLGARLVTDMIAGWAEATPHAVAVVAGDRALTYGELFADAERVANTLQRVGVDPDEVVGLACPRGIEGLTGLLGILLAGGAYLYLDPSWPAARLRLMARECRLALVLTGRRRVDLGLRGSEEPQRLRISAAAGGAPTAGGPPGGGSAYGWWAGRAGGPPVRPPGARPGNLCYVVYTSGSTGTPKGVAVEHRGTANMVRRLAAAFGVGSSVRMLQFASWSWDAAACEILTTLAAGGTLVLAGSAARRGGEELAALLRDQEVHVATLTPSLLAALPDAELPSLATVVAVGEPCPPDLVARWAPGRRFLNGYGPTEATVAVSVGRCRPGEQVTIGRPLRGVRVEVVGETGEPVPRGTPGELVVGGVGLARGYVTPAPDGYPRPGPAVTPGDRFFEAGGVRWYRTGDMVYQRDDEQLVYLGRVDEQVKVRGYRVELTEVEQGVRRHPQVRACGVTTSGGRLIAYVVPRSPDAATAEILAEAARWLPDFMLPSEVRLAEALPLSTNGKLDRQALQALAPAPRVPDPELSRVDLLADTLALVRQALETDQVGPDDDVFDIGGHSLVAAQLAVAATEHFGVPVAALQVYDNPTPARLAALIRRLGPVWGDWGVA